MIEIIIAVVSVSFGGGITFFVVNGKNNTKAKLIIDDAQKNAEQIKKEKILQAKEKFIELKSEHEKVIIKKNNDINNADQRVKQKENTLNQKLAEVNRKDAEFKKEKAAIDQQRSALNKKHVELEKSHKLQVEQLEQISNLSADEAKKQLVATLKDEAKTEALSIINNTIEEAS